MTKVKDEYNGEDGYISKYNYRKWCVELSHICRDFWIVDAFGQSMEIGLRTMNKDNFGISKYAILISWDEEDGDEDNQPL